MEEAAKTIAPEFAKMSGFQRYTGAATGDNQLVLFLSSFDTAEQAKAAQDAASSGSWPNANDGKLELFAAAVTEGYAAFPQDTCFTESQVGKMLTTNLYKYQDPASVDPTLFFPAYQDWYNELYSKTSGFIMSYGSTNAPAGSDSFDWKIMESEADVAAYEKLLAESNYAWTGPDYPADKVIETAGTIGIDVLCTDAHTDEAADVSPQAPAPAPAPADDNAGEGTCAECLPIPPASKIGRAHV